MNGVYITVCSKYKDKKSYGIALIETVDNNAVVLQTIADISLTKIQIDRLVNLCNELHLDPIHLEDVVQDFLAEI